ncbi:hypothetical protein ACS0TY_027350 [Phlomoides rotata]
MVNETHSDLYSKLGSISSLLFDYKNIVVPDSEDSECYYVLEIEDPDVVDFE